jgi:hypothetical protein
MFRALKLLFLLLIPVSMIAQDDDTGGSTLTPLKKKGFIIGIYMGAHFANKYTADAYDGYGFDLDGKRNDFENSYMYNKIVLQYGGGAYGGVDQVAQALNVNHSDWSFTEADMPINMHYVPSFLFGLQCRYSVDTKNGIVLNMNMAKLKVSGNFTIETLPPTGSTQINNSVRYFGITGQEQRFMLQLGYNRLFGKGEKINPFAEGGLNMTYAQFDKNEVLINNLYINLLDFYSNPALGVNVGYTKKPRGFGLGAYAGVGLNINLSEKFLVQIIYSPSYEGIAIGENTRLKLQNSAGLRAYYNFL